MKEAKNAMPWIVLSIIAIAAIAYAAYILGQKNQGDEPQPPVMQACTLEAKLCADGSYVGRIGPNCEFASCPGTTPMAQ